MKKKIFSLLTLIIVIGLVSLSFETSLYKTCKTLNLSYPSGGALGYGAGLSGASWDNSGITCNSCHSGGTYNPTTTLTLLSGTTAVTQYTPGVTYTLQMKITSATGTPKYAFCMMSAKTTLHTNINTWGTCPSGSANHSVTSRNYIEQTSARAATGTSPTSYFTYSIPWTGPAAGSGSITIFAEGMAVNGTGGTDGDSPAAGVSLNVTENTILPVTFVSLNAVKSSNGVNINWVTDNEINTKDYTIETSSNGIDFTTIGKLDASNTPIRKSYTFTHYNPQTGKNFYRIVCTDINARKNYSNITDLNYYSSNNIIISPNPVNNKINFIGQNTNGNNYLVNDLKGNKIKTGTITNNNINISELNPGTYFVTLYNKGIKLKTLKFMKW
jgi:hypothetical protein